MRLRSEERAFDNPTAQLDVRETHMTRERHIQAAAERPREDRRMDGRLHPAWMAFIHYCQELGFGEISQLKIQDGLPVMAEETTKKVKFI